MSAFPIEDALKPECDSIRADLLAIEKRVRALTGVIPGDPVSPGHVHPEVYANRQLAVRHIEDARMRIGKALQHARDGVSCFDAAPGGDALD